MASLESLYTKTYAAQTLTGRVADNKCVAVEFVHVSSNATPSVTIVSNTGITLADVGYTTGSLAFNTYTNLGLLVDKINASYYLYWRARVLDGLRETTTASSVLIPNGVCSTTTHGGETLYEALLDTNVANKVFYRVAQDRGVLRDDMGRLKTEIIPNTDRRVKITGITYRQNVTGVELNGLRVYEVDAVSLAETIVWSAKSVDDTATTHDFTDNPITSAPGNELVVMFNDTTTGITDADTNFLEVNYVRE